MEAKRKKASLAVASVALVAVLAIAGTFAYLQGETDDVVNTFNTNKVTVKLTESGDKNYNIIPGTSQSKDPKVTVDNTVDSYVFVKVDDKTNDLVTYEIADGWTKLDGYDNVYYREVVKDAREKTFSVLKDDEVSYSASLTNDDMLDKNGNLKDDIKLTFTAYAIQQEGFDGSVEDAWLQIPVKVEVSSNDFVEAVKASKVNEVITLTGDVSIDKAIPQSDSGVTNIDLNGKTLTSLASTSTNVLAGKSLSIENGNLEYENILASSSAIVSEKGSSVTLNNVKMSTGGAAIFPRGDAAEVNVINSQIKSEDSFCVATNAAKVENYNVKINLQGSTLNGPTPVLVNIPCSLTMQNCTVFADMQGVVVRGGTAVIEDCKISNTSIDNWAVGYFDNINWGSGNMLPLAGITIGNKSTAYQYPSDVTLKNTTVTSEVYPTVYIHGNDAEDNGATLTYDDASNIGNVTYGGGYVVVNGEVQK